MGQDNSRQINDSEQEDNDLGFKRIKEFYEIEKNLQFIKKIQGDAAYGDIKISKNTINNQIVATKNYIMTKDDDFEKIIEKAKLLHSIKTPYLIKMLNFGKQLQEDFCSKYIRSIIVFEYFKDNMQKKILHRKQLDLLFREVDIYFFLYCIVQGLQKLKEKGFSHGDIRPKTILLGRDGNYKLTECNFMVSQNSYKHFLLGGMGSCYLSPEQLINLKQRDIHPKHDPFLSDIFSMGMICLEMATLTNINTCYDFKNFCIDFERVTSLLNQISQTHSENLAEIIQGMIEIQEDKRWSFDQILQSLQPYINEIQEIHCSPIKHNDNENEDYSYEEEDFNQNVDSQHIVQEKQGYETLQNMDTHKTDKKQQFQQSSLKKLQQNDHSNNNSKLPQQFDDSAASDIPNENDDYLNGQNDYSLQKPSEKSFSPQKQQQLQQQQYFNEDQQNNINLQTDPNAQQVEDEDEPNMSSKQFMEEEHQEERLKHKARPLNRNNLSPQQQPTGQFNTQVSPPLNNISNLQKTSPGIATSKYNDDDQDLLNNLQQLDNMVNNALNQSTNIKEKFSRVSLYNNNNINNNSNIPNVTNSSLQNPSPGDRSNRFTQKTEGNMDDQDLYTKMQTLSQKKKLKSMSPEKSQMQESVQDSPLKGFDSNTLYEMYLEEYNKIKRNYNS